jgi:hypothetical protein
MTVHQAIETFSSYSIQEKTAFLARLAHELTILARDAYDVGQDGLTDPPRLRRINEVQHRVTSFLLALIKNDPKRYPDDVLVRIILEHPEDADFQRQLQEAFDRLETAAERERLEAERAEVWRRLDELRQHFSAMDFSLTDALLEAREEERRRAPTRPWP